MDIEMDKDHTYFKGIWKDEVFEFTEKTTNQLIGIPFKDQNGNIIGEVVAASLEKDGIHYTVRQKLEMPEKRRVDECLFPNRPKYGHRIIKGFVKCKVKDCTEYSSRECHDCKIHCSEDQ